MAKFKKSKLTEAEKFNSIALLKGFNGNENNFKPNEKLTKPVEFKSYDRLTNKIFRK